MSERLRTGLIACAIIMPVPLPASEPDLAAQCARVGNDDAVRPYAPSLRAELLTAYGRLFPGVQVPPDETELEATAHIRCMDGRLLVCFTGANLPCSKLNTSQANAGANRFCRSNPDARSVPAFAVGHDTAFVYGCIAGKPTITGTTFALDPRGFAASLWTPLGQSTPP